MRNKIIPISAFILVTKVSIVLSQAIERRRDEGVCIFDGRVIKEGESFGDLFEVSRCGPWYEFPCYCNLNYDPPIECPYCGIVVKNNNLVCAREDETVSVINTEGVAQDCECLLNTADDGTTNLQATCQDINFMDDDEDLNDDTGGGDDNTTTENVCTLELDGAIQTFQDGESFGDAIKTRCINSSNYPCYCDASLETQIRCPYCGYQTITGEMICANIDETIQFTSFENELTECTCHDDSSASSTCRDLSEPTFAPTISPTIRVTSTPTINPTESPTTEQETPKPTILRTSMPTRTPTTLAPTKDPNSPQPIGYNKPSLAKPNRNPIAQPSSPKPSPDGCFYTSKSDNSIQFVENGKAFGEDVTGPCPNDEFPVYCNTQLSGKREYPYCVFSSYHDETITTKANSYTTTNYDTLCARSGVRVLVSRQDGARELCGCLYNNPIIGPVSQCKMVDFNYTETVTTLSPSISPNTKNNNRNPSTNTDDDIEDLNDNDAVDDDGSSSSSIRAILPMFYSLLPILLT